jgi:hypothetical protein
MDETSAPRNCRKARNRPMPFNCKRGAGHEGNCSPYTLRPLSREQWAALDPANRYRVLIHLDDDTDIPLIWRADRAAAEAELAEMLPEFRESRQRHPYMAQVTGGDIEDRSLES